MSNRIFMTGGTGFLGIETLSQLFEGADALVYVLVRAKNQEAAYHRLKAAYFHNENLYKRIGKEIIPVTGDFTKPGLGLNEADRALLSGQNSGLSVQADCVALDNQMEGLSGVDYVFHVGADISFQKEGSELDQTNREGTANMITFAKEIKGLKRFVYVSTAYVAGSQTGRILEEATKASAFSNYYERSKAEGEKLVFSSGLPYTICRPGMIVGHSKTGWVKNFNTVYYMLKQVLLGKMRVLPADKKQGLNLVPVDYVAQGLVRSAFAKEGEGKIFHLTCPCACQPKAGELLDHVSLWAQKNLNLDLGKRIFAPVPFLKQAGKAFNDQAGVKAKSQLNNLLTLVPYFYGTKEFDQTNTEALMGAYDLNWRDYMDGLLTFACSKNFMQQTERTVFEQANVRRDSKTYPVTYHDVKAEGIKSISGQVVNRRIQKILSALCNWGIQGGDKVALTGINCVDYMMLDQALGLLGAVTVPIYYTTPIEEAKLLLEGSGAKWFFVGDQRIMKQIHQLDIPVQLVAFSNARSLPNPNGMDWEDFLKKGKKKVSVLGPDPDDLATIRYTSGTTGAPKGVMFNYHQLAWMGEVLTNLLSWKARNKEMRYLSFLPESHVVEGILASYAPYYMLAKVDFYFLNDFDALVDALPKVRPTVFFSVPRFYEKLWEQLKANSIGQRYLAMKQGPAKEALAKVLKKVILKKAGLDACDQLIVGSAPMSEALLREFRALGIEIHNAYGQTEAPLITINRLGDNVIPSIGTPLPETEVWVKEDGELMVKGPQVCLGYYGLETDTVVDGVLKTGDLGSIDEQGHISLFGRKKEMIITAYGKNISIPKIEETLKNIPCVSEAVLIGENRPYCTALLWLEGDSSELDKQIEAANQNLSHPEQIRRYQVIEEPLSIQKGELTPNLKVKRDNVEAHYQDLIEEMYS